MTWNTTTKTIYINGSVSGTKALVGIVGNGTGVLYLGQNSVNTNDDLDGRMDEFFMYDAMMNSSQASCIYNSGTGRDYAGTNTCLAIVTNNLSITALDIYNSTALNIFNATVTFNGTTVNLTTITGTIQTNFTVNSSQTANITVYANNYFSNTTTANSSTRAVTLYPYTIVRAYSGVTSIANFTTNYTNNANSSESGIVITTNSIAYLPLYNGVYTVTVYDANNAGVNYAMDTETITANPYLQAYNFSLFLTNSLFLYFYDEITATLINTSTVTLYLTGTIASYNYTTSTGITNATLITPDSYVITFTAPGYNQRQIIYTLTNQTATAISLFLLTSGNSSTIETFYENQNLQRIEGTNITLSRKNLSGTNYYDVYGCSSDANGRCIINAQTITATYRLCYSYSVFSACSGDLQFTSNDVSIGRTFQLTTTTSLNNYYAWNTLGQTAGIAFSPNSTNPNGTVTLNVQNSALVATQACLTIYRLTGNTRTLESNTCTTGGATSVMTVTGFANVTTGGDTIEAVGSIVIGGLTYDIVESSVNISNTGLSSQGQRLSLLVVIVAVVLTLIFSYTWNPVAPPFITAFVLYVFWSIGLLVINFTLVMSVVVIAVIVWLIIGRRT
jgi:hypothetical protein